MFSNNNLSLPAGVDQGPLVAGLAAAGSSISGAPGGPADMVAEDGFLIEPPVGTVLRLVAPPELRLLCTASTAREEQLQLALQSLSRTVELGMHCFADLEGIVREGNRQFSRDLEGVSNAVLGLGGRVTDIARYLHMVDREQGNFNRLTRELSQELCSTISDREIVLRKELGDKFSSLESYLAQLTGREQQGQAALVSRMEALEARVDGIEDVLADLVEQTEALAEKGQACVDSHLHLQGVTERLTQQTESLLERCKTVDQRQQESVAEIKTLQQELARLEKTTTTFFKSWSNSHRELSSIVLGLKRGDPVNTNPRPSESKGAPLPTTPQVKGKEPLSSVLGMEPSSTLQYPSPQRDQ